MTDSRISFASLFRPAGALLLSLAVIFLWFDSGDAPALVASAPTVAAPTVPAPTEVPAPPQAAAPTVAAPTAAIAEPTAVPPSPTPELPAPSPTALPEAPTPTIAPEPADAGRVYIVERQDWLTTIAQRFYGDPQLYRLIMDATNARAEVDPSFSRISNEDLLLPGQKLWIPEKPAGR